MQSTRIQNVAVLGQAFRNTLDRHSVRGCTQAKITAMHVQKRGTHHQTWYVRDRLPPGSADKIFRLAACALKRACSQNPAADYFLQEQSPRRN